MHGIDERISVDALARSVELMIEILRAVKYTLLLLAMSVAIKWLIVYSQQSLFILLIAIYLLSRFYYKYRLGREHPSVVF